MLEQRHGVCKALAGTSASRRCKCAENGHVIVESLEQDGQKGKLLSAEGNGGSRVVWSRASHEGNVLWTTRSRAAVCIPGVR